MSDIEEIYRDYFKDVFLFLRGAKVRTRPESSESISSSAFVRDGEDVVNEL